MPLTTIPTISTTPIDHNTIISSSTASLIWCVEDTHVLCTTNRASSVDEARPSLGDRTLTTMLLVQLAEC